MVEKIFYGVPHKAGVFHGEDHVANEGDYVKQVWVIWDLLYLS